MKKTYIIVGILCFVVSLCGGCSNLTGFSGGDGDGSSQAIEEMTPSPLPESTPAVPETPEPAPTSRPGLTPSPEPSNIPEPSASAAPDLNLEQPEEKALKLLEDMTLEEKVGQMFFVRCKNDTANTDIQTYHMGGYLLFAEDFADKSKKEMQETIRDYQKLSALPMLIGVDEEGGTVNRISKYKQYRSYPFHSPQELFQEGGYLLIKSDTVEKAKLLKSLGINVNLAPVCDVSTAPADFIYRRSFGKPAKETSEYVKTVVTEMKLAGIGCTLKHFPGYGNNVDTHTGIAVDERSLNSFKENDFLPFQAGIDAGAGSILVSHNIVKAMDDTYPASLSPAVHKILRDELGFTGVIMTDDLSMEAVTKFTGDEEAAVLAVEAGNDLLIATDFKTQIPALLQAVKNNTITEERIDESVMRILTWKLSLGIIP